MVLPIVVLTAKPKLLNDRETKGLFLTVENGVLGYKTKNNGSYTLSDGNKIENENILIYPCYIEGGTRGVEIPITEKQEDDLSGFERKSHPAYGMITLSKQSVSPPQPLFGSSIKHGNIINMSISHGEYERGINHDWYHARGRICEIELSLSQFADIITSIGSGDGTPCTIYFTERDGYAPKVDYVSKVEQFSTEFDNQLQGVQQNLDETYSLVKQLFDSKKTLNKSDKELILNALYSAKQNVGCNASYVYDSFNEQMDKTIKEAKGELEAFMQAKLHHLAVEAIGQNTDAVQLETVDMKKVIEIE